jgi:hypothetical protein
MGYVRQPVQFVLRSSSDRIEVVFLAISHREFRQSVKISRQVCWLLHVSAVSSLCLTYVFCEMSFALISTNKIWCRSLFNILNCPMYPLNGLKHGTDGLYMPESCIRTEVNHCVTFRTTDICYTLDFIPIEVIQPTLIMDFEISCFLVREFFLLRHFESDRSYLAPKLILITFDNIAFQTEFCKSSCCVWLPNKSRSVMELWTILKELRLFVSSIFV